MSPIPIAFYAPLKSPRHPTPSGDRTMARLLLQALAAAGFQPEIGSELRTFEPTGDMARQRELRNASLAEAQQLVTAYRARPPGERPRLWFTYHSYYKAPDWIGPAVADALGIPYVLAEATRAGKRAGGLWALAHGGAESALRRADAVFVMTARDREALERDLPPGQALVSLPPFIDLCAWPTVAAERHGSLAAAPRLLTVAMMREGDKLASYRLLAAALGSHLDRAWTFDIVGDGPARPEVERLFAFAGDRVAFHGRLEPGLALARLYDRASLFVWPAVNEAYGMVLLEAQAHGCPVLAGRHGGVADAMVDGVTGLLVPPDDPAAFGDALATLIGAPDRLAGMREPARRFIAGERGLDRAAGILAATLRPSLARTAAA